MSWLPGRACLSPNPSGSGQLSWFLEPVSREEACLALDHLFVCGFQPPLHQHPKVIGNKGIQFPNTETGLRKADRISNGKTQGMNEVRRMSMYLC